MSQYQMAENRNDWDLRGRRRVAHDTELMVVSVQRWRDKPTARSVANPSRPQPSSEPLVAQQRQPGLPTAMNKRRMSMFDFDCEVQERAEEFALSEYGCELQFLLEGIQAELSAKAAQHICENSVGDYGVQLTYRDRRMC